MEKGLYAEYLIAQRRDDAVLVFKAVSHAKLWPTKLLSRIRRKLDVLKGGKKVVEKISVRLCSYAWMFAKRPGSSLDILIGADRDAILVDTLHVVFHNAHDVLCGHVIFSGDELASRCSIIHADGTREGFRNIVIPREKLYIGFCGSLNSLNGMPTRASVQLTGFSFSSWKEFRVVRTVRLKPLPCDLLSSPVEGTWLCLNAPGPQSLHMDSVILKNDGVLFPQQFALDLASEKDVDSVGAQTSNSRFIGFGSPVRCVAEGTVVVARDDVHDNAPGARNHAVPGGNHILVRHIGGWYSFYAHLKKASLLISVGQRVHAGQMIAAVGNSGNSTIPHLHFQLSMGRDPLRSESIPPVFRKTGFPESGKRIQ